MEAGKCRAIRQPCEDDGQDAAVRSRDIDGLELSFEPAELMLSQTTFQVSSSPKRCWQSAARRAMCGSFLTASSPSCQSRKKAELHRRSRPSGPNIAAASGNISSVVFWT